MMGNVVSSRSPLWRKLEAQALESVRKHQAALRRQKAEAELRRQNSIDDAEFARLLAMYREVRTPQGPQSHLKHLIKFVCAEHDIPVSVLMSEQRDAKTSECRRAIIARAAAETDLPLVQIGARLGLDHSTVIHAVQRHVVATGVSIRKWTPERCRAALDRKHRAYLAWKS